MTTAAELRVLLDEGKAGHATMVSVHRGRSGIAVSRSGSSFHLDEKSGSLYLMFTISPLPHIGDLDSGAPTRIWFTDGHGRERVITGEWLTEHVILIEEPVTA